MRFILKYLLPVLIFPIIFFVTLWIYEQNVSLQSRLLATIFSSAIPAILYVLIMPLTWYFSRRYPVRLLLAIGLPSLITANLFRIMHWPGQQIYFWIGTALFVTALIVWFRPGLRSSGNNPK